jgi:fructoselysine 6-kinase
MHIVGIGDNVVDRYLHLGQMFPGGNALNVAVFARRGGAQAAYIGVLGDDDAGRLVLAALRDEGVDVSRVRVANGPNACADVTLVDGDRRFVGGSLGVSRFEPDAADLAAAQAGDLVHSSVYSGLEDWVRRVRADLPISFDFSDHLDKDYVGSLAPGLAYALFSTSSLSPQASEDFVRQVVASGARLALATRGAAGVIACLGDRCWTQPAHPTTIVDTLGAGDAFLAGFLVAHLDGATPPEALARGVEIAAQACTYYGAFGHGGPIDSPAIFDTTLGAPTPPTRKGAAR